MQKRSLCRKQKGLSAIELTIAMPFILLMLYIAVDFGRVMTEMIITMSSAASSTSYGTIHSDSLDKSLDHNAMLAAATKDASNLQANEGKDSTITMTTEQVCRCYNKDAFKDGGSLPEPTVAACSNSCSDTKEVYIQTTVVRNFESFGGHAAIPESIEINRTARYRVE